MGQTDIYKLRWPERTGVAADGPDGYKDLAEDVEKQMIRMRGRASTMGGIPTTYIPVPPGESRSILDLNLVPPVAGWVQVEWWATFQWTPGTWHGARLVAQLGVPNLAQSIRVQRFQNRGMGMNGQYAGRLANPTTNRLGQRFQLACNTDTASDPRGNFRVMRAAYSIQYYGGNAVATTNAYQIGHGDFGGADSTRVTSYTLTPEPATKVGDWLYLVHMNYRETADVTPGMPSGFSQITAPQVSGAVSSGIQWVIWRKKRAAGDPASYTVTMPSGRICRATLITVRQPNDTLPTFSAFTAPRAATNPSRITVPGAVAVQPGALVIPIALQNTTVAAAQPATAAGATPWYSVPASGSTTTMLAVASQSYSEAMSTDPTIFGWTTADAGRIGGVALIFPPV